MHFFVAPSAQIHHWTHCLLLPVEQELDRNGDVGQWPEQNLSVQRLTEPVHADRHQIVGAHFLIHCGCRPLCYRQSHRLRRGTEPHLGGCGLDRLCTHCRSRHTLYFPLLPLQPQGIESVAIWPSKCCSLCADDICSLHSLPMHSPSTLHPLFLVFCAFSTLKEYQFCCRPCNICFSSFCRYAVRRLYVTNAVQGRIRELSLNSESKPHRRRKHSKTDSTTQNGHDPHRNHHDALPSVRQEMANTNPVMIATLHINDTNNHSLTPHAIPQMTPYLVTEMRTSSHSASDRPNLHDTASITASMSIHRPPSPHQQSHERFASAPPSPLAMHMALPLANMSTQHSCPPQVHHHHSGSVVHHHSHHHHHANHHDSGSSSHHHSSSAYVAGTGSVMMSLAATGIMAHHSSQSAMIAPSASNSTSKVHAFRSISGIKIDCGVVTRDTLWLRSGSVLWKGDIVGVPRNICSTDSVLTGCCQQPFLLNGCHCGGVLLCSIK